MKLQFQPLIRKDKITYSFKGETVTFTYQGVTETIDLSELEHGDRYEGLPEGAAPIDPIISADRAENGTLLVVLKERVNERPAWYKSPWYDSEKLPGGIRSLQRKRTPDEDNPYREYELEVPEHD